MTTNKVSVEVAAQLTTKVATMSNDQAWGRMTEIANRDEYSAVDYLEFAKLL